jgi:anti-anti-sigma factor
VGRFDFRTHQEFRRAYEEQPSPPAEYVIDLRETEYLDSSALGMLLLLRRYAGDGTSQIRLANPSDGIKRTLSVANFQQLFDIA